MISSTPTSPTEILYGIYGRKAPVQCLGRLKTEEELIRSRKSFFRDAELIVRLGFEADRDGSEIAVFFNFGASLINWMYGASIVNPLPPHYCCKTCKKIIFSPADDGWDLPERECCGQPMVRDGHSIPSEALASKLNCCNELTILLAESFADRAEDFIHEFYRRDYVMTPFEDEFERKAERRFILIPVDCPLPQLNENGIWQTDLRKVEDSGYQIITLAYKELKEKVRNYRKKTGLKPSIDDLLTIPVMAATQAKLINEIIEKGSTPPKSDDPSFSTLLRTLGYIASTQTEANPMLWDSNARYTDFFFCREQVWEMVSKALKPEYGISSSFAEMITKYTGQGRFTNNRMELDTEQVLRYIGIEDRWIEQMKQTCYLPPKADLIPRLLDYMKLAWYELKDESRLIEEDRNEY